MPPATLDTVASLVRARADDTNVGLRFEGRMWTWAELVDEMEVRARLLRALVPSEPFHVGVLLENVPEYVFTLGGAALAGGVVVGVNPTRRGDELARDVRHADCQLVLTDAAGAELLRDLDLGPAGRRVLTVGAPEYDAALTTQRSSRPVEATAAPADLFLLIFTSGSTGAPKAVRVTQGRAASAARGAMPFGPDDVLYCAMPLFHGNSLMSIVFPALGRGASILLKRRFSASEFLPDVRAHGCTFFSTVGRALAYILATPETPDDRDHDLKFVLAPESSTADAAAFRARFGCPVVSGYGSSENAVVMVPRPGLPPDALGVPLDGLDVAIVDTETGEECPRVRFDEHGRLLNADEAIGEIVGRNALDRFEGYYRNPEATAQRTREGWYWSGDLGYRDDAGVFYFAGRTADWLRVDGENFAAAPVERIVARFPGVSGVAVFGVPDERTADDQVMAAIELASAARFEPDRFDEFLAEQRDLGTKWAPRYVRVLRALPVNATNKIDKPTLRSAGWDVDDIVYWRPERRGPLQPMSDEDVVELRRRFEAHRRSATRRR